jgi:hypothetical protein
MHTLTYIDAHGQPKTLTFHTKESYDVAVTMAEAGGLVVVK